MYDRNRYDIVNRVLGVMEAPREAGLGVELCYDMLGEPIFEAVL